MMARHAMNAPKRPPVRLAEIVALLSLGTDLGLGQPMEHMIRACLVALRLADKLGLPEAERRVLYYSGLLAWVGCHTDAYEQARWFGDDLSLKWDTHYGFDFGRTTDFAAFMVKYIGGAGRPLLTRARASVGFLRDGRKAVASLFVNHYRATDELAERLGLGDDVRAGLKESFERWDGKGALRLKGEQILLTSRLINLADVVEVFRRTAGVEAAIAVAQKRRGTHFDPALVDMFCERAHDLFEGLEETTTWDTLISAEPALATVVPEERLDDVFEALGSFAELKSPWALGHARGLAELTVEAGRCFGLPDADLVSLRRATFIHDIGALGVSNEIWDKRGPLTASEWERVRLHPYLTQRMLAFSPALAPLGEIAGLHHERLDGSGYPRGVQGSAIGPAARILAAADTYRAMTEERPHRAARAPDDAAAELRAEVSRGRLDGGAVAAVLRAEGHRVPRQREHPAGLTAREVEVLRLLARGLANKEIAQRLFISAKTVGNHIEHIYTKIGSTNRATASLFAQRHGLMVDV
jgi:HD-GYP domain-containing protein (c-di-GMP phosphodiesterase class II)